MQLSPKSWTKAHRSMLCVDVSVLVYAHRKDLAEHQTYRPLLEQLANGEEPLALPDIVLSGFIRQLTRC
jgi:predicted nucleic acid-binding protein